jgi:hypothetical protein
LYTGRRLPRVEKYALQVINGFIPNDREPRGRAWIHCSGPNMWACAAPAYVKTRCECKLLGLHQIVVMQRQRLADRLGEIQVVFTDYEALPDYILCRETYWDIPYWQVPHVLFVAPELMPLQPPPGWSSIEWEYHSKMGVGCVIATFISAVRALQFTFPTLAPFAHPH